MTFQCYRHINLHMLYIYTYRNYQPVMTEGVLQHLLECLKWFKTECCVKISISSILEGLNVTFF